MKKMILVQKSLLAYFTNRGASKGDLVEKNIQYYKKVTRENNDIIYKKVPTSEGVVTLIYPNSLTEKMTLEMMVMIPIANYIHQIHQVAESVNPFNIADITNRLSIGETLLYFHETNRLLNMDTYSVNTRDVSISEMESTFIGPQDVFTESLETNLSLVKRRIQIPCSKMKN